MNKFVSPGDIEGKLERKRNIFLSLLRKHPGISRQECAKLMRVSTFNITKLVPELIAEGMVIEDEPVFSDAVSRGRPSLPLRLNPEYEYFAGVDIEASQWRFAVVDFAGEVVYSRIEPFKACSGKDEYVSLLKKLLEENIAKCGPVWSKVASLGVGAPGFLDKDGAIENYEILPNFKQIPLLDIYRRITKKETFIINNICNLAIYDLWKRPNSLTESVLHVAVRSGISISMTINGRLYRGAGGKAGEAGLFFFPGIGSLQEFSGLAALKRQFPNLPADFWNGKTEAVDQACSDARVKSEMNKALELLAAALANISAFLDPAKIMVYSSLFTEENQLWEVLKKEFSRFREGQQLPLPPFQRIVQPELKAAIGAALYSMESIYTV